MRKIFLSIVLVLIVFCSFAENPKVLINTGKGSIDSVRVEYNSSTKQFIFYVKNIACFKINSDSITDRRAHLGGNLNYVLEDSVVGMVLKGNATQWNDVVTSAIQTRVTPATSKPNLNIDSLALEFVRDADSNEIAYFSIQMPHSVTYGTTRYCSPHFHYMQYAAGDTTFQVALWYRIKKLGAASNPWVRLRYEKRAALPYTAAPFHQICEFPDITLNNVSESSLIDFKMYRYDSAGNPATIYFKMFDVHFEMEKLGTYIEYPQH